MSELHPAENPEVRKTGLGGSDMAAVLGLSPYSTAFDVWLEKTGRVAPFAGNSATELGSLAEDIVAQQYIKDTGNKVQRRNQTARRQDAPWAFAHIDRKVVGVRAALEIKTTTVSEGWGDAGTDQIPTHILPQVHHQMWVEELDYVDVAVWMMHRWSIQYYRVEYDADWCSILANAGGRIWEMVEADEPPPVDYSHRYAVEALTKAYGVDKAKVINLPEHAVAIHETYKHLSSRAADCERAAKVCKAELLHMMEDAWVGMLPDGTCYRRQLTERKGYTVDDTTYLDFRHVKNPPKGAIQND